MECIIRPEDREEFLSLIEQLRLIFLRNGALLYRVDENLENPGTFRTEMLVASWAEHVRQHTRTTKAEVEIAERAWSLHAGEDEPIVRHYIKANRMSTPLGFGQFRKQNESRSSKAASQRSRETTQSPGVFRAASPSDSLDPNPATDRTDRRKARHSLIPQELISGLFTLATRSGKWASPAIIFWASLIDLEFAAAFILSVQTLDGRVTFRDIAHRNEPKAARLAGFAIRDQFDFSNRAERLKEFPQ